MVGQDGAASGVQVGHQGEHADVVVLRADDLQTDRQTGVAEPDGYGAGRASGSG